MRSVKHKSGRRYLKCPTRHLSKDSCIGAFVSVEKLESAVLAELNCLSASRLDTENLKKNSIFRDDYAEKRNAIEKNIASSQKRLSEYSASLRELYIDKVKGILSETDFLDFSREFSNEKDQIEKQIQEYKRRISVLEKNTSSGTDQSERLNRYLHPKQLNRVIVDTMIDHIRIGKKNPGTNEIPIEIHWKF